MPAKKKATKTTIFLRVKRDTKQFFKKVTTTLEAREDRHVSQSAALEHILRNLKKDSRLLKAALQ